MPMAQPSAENRRQNPNLYRKGDATGYAITTKHRHGGKESHGMDSVKDNPKRAERYK